MTTTRMKWRQGSVIWEYAPGLHWLYLREGPHDFWLWDESEHVHVPHVVNYDGPQKLFRFENWETAY